jgi:hypothetical protein
MYVARLTHIATGYPAQVEISLFDYLNFKVFKSGYELLCSSIESKLGIDFELDYFIDGVDHVK